MREMLSGTEWGELDLLLFDLPPGAERTLQFAEFLGSRAEFVLVTLPSALASGIVNRSLAALRSSGSRVLGHVLNMDGYACDGCGEVRPLFPGANDATLETELLGSVPFDPQLAAISDSGQMLNEAPDCPAAHAVGRLADTLIDLLES